MKNRKFRVLMVLTLIVALTISAPMSVSAKAKKVGKTKEAMAMTYCEASAEIPGKVELRAACSGAKNVVFYRASKVNGKYTKVATTKVKTPKLIASKPGLSFYKVQGVNGKKKGALSKAFASYKANFEVKDVKLDNGLVLECDVDNSNGTCDMVFNNGKELQAVVNYLGQDFIAKGSLVDETGAAQKSVTIAKGEQGKVYVSGTLEGVPSEMLSLAQPLIQQILQSGGKTTTANVSLTMTLKVKSGSKSYSMKAVANTSEKGFFYGISN